MGVLASLLARESAAWSAHRAAVRGSTLPRPHEAPRAFVHGFSLLFSVLTTVLRDATLRRFYLRTLGVRAAIVIALTLASLPHWPTSRHIAFDWSSPQGEHMVFDSSPDRADDDDDDEVSAAVGRSPAIIAVAPAHEPRRRDRVRSALEAIGAEARAPYLWIVALLGTISLLERVTVFFSRRYDDWVSFHASRLVDTPPEDPEAPTPAIRLDLRWLKKKVYRRARGYVIVAAGMPLAGLLSLLPFLGDELCKVAAALWTLYCVGIFTAAKSGLAWRDGAAPAALPVRTWNERVTGRRWCYPLVVYGRIWARMTASVNAPAAAFERNPASFLGLAVARALSVVPGFYLVMHAIVPVAAGRLITESDAADPTLTAPIGAPPLTSLPVTLEADAE